MKISEIYLKYNIPENLQEHMLRVAAVGNIVLDFLDEKVKLDRKVITTELLLHDMGNILKYSFDGHIHFSDEEIERLQKVKKEFAEKYGPMPHEATLQIMKELEVDPKVIEIFDSIGSSKLPATLQSDDWHRKVASYSDFRVAPYGIVSVNERFDDIVKRYKDRNHPLADLEKTEGKRRNVLELERQIQEKSSKDLVLINEKEVEELVKQLKDFEI